MEYTTFAFKNFKGIGDMTIPLNGDVTTLIGLNESGKTTVLEAIFCFSYGAENLDVLDPSMASLREPERWIPISLRSNFNETIEISATVQLDNDDQVRYAQHMKQNYDVRLASTPSDIIITEKYFFENSRYSKTQRNWGLRVRGTRGRERKDHYFLSSSEEWRGAIEYFKSELPRIWYFPNFLFELPERFLLDAADDDGESNEERDKSGFYRLTFERILDQIGRGANLDTHIVERVKSVERADQRNLKAMLLEMGREVTNTVYVGWSRIFGRAPVNQEVELDAAEGEDGHAYLELKIKDQDGYYDLSERSLGFRWFFMFLLLTSYRDVGDGRNVIFLLDEPASNLHSSAQAELLKSFEKLAERCRLIYTTHSHHLINIKWLDAAYVIKNDAIGEFELDSYLATRTAARTAISAIPYRTFVSKNPSATSYFQPVLDLLEYRPSDLEPVPNVVMLEGKSDFYLLRYAIDVLGMQPKPKLVPGTGAGTLDTMIRLHIGWGKSFLVLLDGDREGRRQKARYERDFGPIMNGSCHILPDLLGSPATKEIEDLLESDDRQRIIDTIYSSGLARPRGKKALSQAIMELYARREAIKLSTESIDRLTLLAERLEVVLGEVWAAQVSG